MLEAGVGAVRVVRALGFLAAVVWLTAAGHTLGGGEASPAGVAALAFLAWPVALAGSRRQRRLRHLLPVLAVGQLAGHGLLDFFAAGGSALGACEVSGGHHALHLGCAPELGGDAALAVMAPMPSMTTTGLGMAAMHLLAALALALLLARGEVVLWSVIDRVLHRVPRLAPLEARLDRPTFDVALRPLLRLRIVVPARGPPVVV